MGNKYHIKKRVFLNRNINMPAYIIAIVEDTSRIPDENKNGWKYGEITLNLSDCVRNISYDFEMDTKVERKRSLYKIRRLADTINAVRDAIEKEVESIDARSSSRKPKTKTAKA